MAMKFGPSQSHIPMIRKFGLKNRKPRLKSAQPKLSKIMKLDNKSGE
jgi:hypothetical protein